MPRLTRTQKFAELRERLANDAEASGKSKELSAFEDKFRNLQQQSNPAVEEIVEKKIEEAAPVIEEKVEEILSRAEDKIEEVAPVKEEAKETVDGIRSEVVENIHSFLHGFSFGNDEEKTVAPEPVKEVPVETPVEETPAEVKNV